MPNFNMKKAARIVLAVAVLCGLTYTLISARGILYPFVIALLISYILNTPVTMLEKRGFSRVSAILLVYLVILGSLSMLVIYLLPHIVTQLELFAANVPKIGTRIQQLAEDMQSRYQSALLPFSLRQALDDTMFRAENALQQFVQQLVRAILEGLSYSIGFVVAPILAFYILKDWEEIKLGLKRIAPTSYQQDLHQLADDVDEVLSGVIRSQLLVALLVGILVTLGLTLLHVDFALLIGMLAGVLDIIPYFGAIFGAVPAISLAMLQSPWLALKVIVLFVIVHQIESNIIAPKLLGNSVGLHPLTVIFVLLVGGEIAGLVGMLLAVPVTAIAKVIAKHVFERLV